MAKTTKFLPLVALRSIISKTGLGVYASSDIRYKDAVFGRDSLEVAEDLLYTNRLLVKRILLTLGSLQGEVYAAANEEEPGKIIHEYRSHSIDGKPIRGVQLQIFEQLSQRWGGTDEEVAYYGSIDATPHFVRVMGRFVHRYGDRILKEKIVLRSGYPISMKIVTENAVTWLCDQLDNSQSGLLEYHRRNPQGHLNQVWKDSEEFYTHEDGSLANHDKPIASIEVQALAYDALQVAAHLFPAQKEAYHERAKKLRDLTLDLLWLPERKYFALGTDFDKKGNLRIIKTSTANPAALLDSYFFYDLPEEERKRYVKAIVTKITGPDFLTDAGIRSRALSAANLVAFWDYHGSFVTWPKETYDIAKGLKRQGFPKLCAELENRIINVILKNREYPEFVYVDGHGRVLAASPAKHMHPELMIVESINKPENIQAWTVSAVLAIINSRLTARFQRKSSPGPITWQTEAELKILSKMPRVKRLLNPIALRARYPTYPYILEEPKQ